MLSRAEWDKTVSVVVHLDRKQQFEDMLGVFELLGGLPYHAEIWAVYDDCRRVTPLECWGRTPQELKPFIEQAYTMVSGVGSLLCTNGTDVPVQEFGIKVNKTAAL